MSETNETLGEEGWEYQMKPGVKLEHKIYATKFTTFIGIGPAQELIRKANMIVDKIYRIPQVTINLQCRRKVTIPNTKAMESFFLSVFIDKDSEFKNLTSTFVRISAQEGSRRMFTNQKPGSSISLHYNYTVSFLLEYTQDPSKIFS